MIFFQIFFQKYLFGQSISFQKVYGKQGFNYSRSVSQTLDGGYIITGSMSSQIVGASEVYLLKTDSLGTIQWENNYGGPEIDWANNVLQLKDSGYILIGSSNSFNDGNYDIYLIRTDSKGGIVWSHTYGGEDWDFGNSIVQTPDGGFMIVGETYSFGNGGNDIYLIKIDSKGDTIYTKTFGGVGNETGSEIVKTKDRNFLIVGTTSSYGAGKEDGYLLKVDSLGNTLWSKTIGGTDDEEFYSVKECPDKGFILAGASKTNAVGKFDFYIQKTDSLGNLAWNDFYGGPDDDIWYSIINKSGGGYMVTGYSVSSIGQGGEEVFIKEISDSGLFRNSTTFGGPHDERGRAVFQTRDRGFIITGETNSFGPNLSNVYLIKVDSLFNAPIYNGVFQKDLAPKANIQVSPNPFSEIAVISINKNLDFGSWDFVLYNLFGIEVFKGHSFGNDFIFHRNEISSGMYLYKVFTKNELIGVGKILIK